VLGSLGEPPAAGRGPAVVLAAGWSWSRDWAPVSGHSPLQRLRQVLDPICGSHEASFFLASACSSAMRVSSTRDLMSSLRNTWRRWNATVCVLMNS
jgi:hypothetical protein